MTTPTLRRATAACAFAIDYEHELELLEALVAQGFIRLPWRAAEPPAAVAGRLNLRLSG